MNALALGLLGVFAMISSVAVIIFLAINQIVVGFWFALLSFFIFVIASIIFLFIELRSNWLGVVLGIVIGASIAPAVFYIV